MDRLEQKLRESTPSFSPSAGFTDRVMESLENPVRGTRTQRAAESAPWVRRLIVMFAAATCVVLVAMQLLPRQKPPIREPQIAANLAEIKIPEISLAKVEALTAKLDEPLELELKNVISDTRQAIQFVASNFLPEN